MPKIISERPDAYVRKLTAPGSYSVGGVQGLMLKVSKTGARSWVVRATVGGTRKDIGCGSYPTVTLAEARSRARTIHSQIASGVDPLAAKAEAKAKLRVAAVHRVTFREATDAVYKVRSKEWGSAQHVKNWWDSFERHVFRSSAIPRSQT